MTTTRKFTTAVLTAALIAMGSTAALADTMQAGVNGFSPDPLKVLSNGQEYTKLDVLGMTNMSAHIEYDVGTAGRIHSLEVIPVIENGYGIASQIPGLADYKWTQSYPLGSRPKSVSKNVVMSIPGFKLNSAAVGMCNWLANTLRGQGKTNAQIFGTDQQVSFNMSVIFNVDASGAGSGSPIYEYTPPRNVKVVCQKWHGSQIPTVGGLKAPLQVTKATMKLKEIATVGGACMVKLTTAIVATEANATIKFRNVHSSGKKSKTFTVKTAGNKIAVVTQQWEIPNKAGPEAGWIQMEGVSPNFHSNKAGYNMNCKSGGGQVGGYKPTPGKPKVAVPLGGSGLRSN